MRPPLAALLLAGVLVTSGCLGFLGDSRPESDQQALDALNRTRAALDNVTSYRALNTGTATMTNGDERTAVAIDGQVRVNVSAREMTSTGRVNDTFLVGTGTRRTYVDGYTAYTECKLTGWGRETLSQSRDWSAYTPIGDELAVLDGTPVYWEGTERLNGTETAVIVAHPNRQELDAAPSVWSMGPEDPEEANFKNATLTLWVDTETWRPVQTRRSSNWGADGANVNLTATWQYDDYDEPANVTRPSFNESNLREDGC
jgi:hypothetical protein